MAPAALCRLIPYLFALMVEFYETLSNYVFQLLAQGIAHPALFRLIFKNYWLPTCLLWWWSSVWSPAPWSSPSGKMLDMGLTMKNQCEFQDKGYAWFVCPCLSEVRHMSLFWLHFKHWCKWTFQLNLTADSPPWRDSWLRNQGHPKTIFFLQTMNHS